MFKYRLDVFDRKLCTATTLTYWQCTTTHRQTHMFPTVISKGSHKTSCYVERERLRIQDRQTDRGQLKRPNVSLQGGGILIRNIFHTQNRTCSDRTKAGWSEVLVGWSVKQLWHAGLWFPFKRMFGVGYLEPCNLVKLCMLVFTTTTTIYRSAPMCSPELDSNAIWNLSNTLSVCLGLLGVPEEQDFPFLLLFYWFHCARQA